MNYIWIFWLAVSILCFIIESLTVNLVTIWFGISGILTTIVSVFFPSLVGQVTIFIVATLVLLIFTRPAMVKILKVQPTNSMSLIGDTAMVVEEIDNDNASGQVSINSNIWRAKSADGENLKEGEKVKIKEIKGVTLIVERKDD